MCPEGSGVPGLTDGGREHHPGVALQGNQGIGQYPDWKAWERMNQAHSLMASLTAGPEMWAADPCPAVRGAGGNTATGSAVRWGAERGEVEEGLNSSL